jgi:hypothetical protein
MRWLVVSADLAGGAVAAKYVDASVHNIRGDHVSPLRPAPAS